MIVQYSSEAWADEGAYHKLIERYVSRQFPQMAVNGTEDKVDGVMSAFLGTKQFRIGPLPNPESIVKMRDVIRNAINTDSRIPLLIPSAARKFHDASGEIDMAELSALQILGCTVERVQRFHPPGMIIHIRMEDLTKRVISSDIPWIEHRTERYISDFRKLIYVLGYSDFIKAIAESDLADPVVFKQVAKQAADEFILHINNRNELHQWPSPKGWTGNVSEEMISFLSARYRKLYPTVSDANHVKMISEYLGTIVARRRLGAYGGWDRGQLEISFASPLPDAPHDSTRVQYRTVPRSESTYNTPYYNAHGHLRISSTDDVRLSLNPDRQLQIGHITLTEGDVSVRIGADYSLE